MLHKALKKKTVTTKNRSLKISYFVACIWSLIGIYVADINTLDMG